MSLEGYTGPDSVDQGDTIDSESGITDIPQSIESEQTSVESESGDTKDALNSLKQDISNLDIQLNNKIDETIDTFIVLSEIQLSDEDREKLKTMLLESSKNLDSPKSYLDKVSTDLKKLVDDLELDGNEKITIQDFEDTIFFTAEDQQVLEQRTEVSEQKTEVLEQETEVSEQETEKSKQKTEGLETGAVLEEQEIEEGEKIINFGEKKEELSISNDKIIKLIQISNLKGLDLDNIKYGDIINRIQNLDKDKLSDNNEEEKSKLKKILEELNHSEVLMSIRDDLEEGDFEDFEKAIVGLDYRLRDTFDNLPVIEAKAEFIAGVESLNGADMFQSTLSIKTDDGFEIEAGKDGRKLSIVGSEYKMESNIKNNSGDKREFVKKESKNKENIFGVNEILNSVSNILDYVDEAIANSVDIEEAKSIIQKMNPDLYSQLNLANATSLASIKQQLSGLYNKKEEEKDRLLEERNELLDELVKKNAEKARESDERKKETLKFLDSIGFDELPQDATNDIIETINNGSDKATFGFKNKIDLANGNLGINLDGDINSFGIAEKKFFAEFMNVLLSGEKGKPIDIATMETGIPVFKDSAGEPIADKDAYIKKLIGMDAKGFIVKNINKFKEGDKKQTK